MNPVRIAVRWPARWPLTRVVVVASRSTLRGFSSSNDGSSSASTANMEWRKKQLNKLESKFQEDSVLTIESEEDLQPMWKAMESRVKNRAPRTREENGGKSGRVNIKRTDEEMWLQEGLYDEIGDDEKSK